MNTVFMWSPIRTNWPKLLVIHRICPDIHRLVIVGEINAITPSSDVPAAALFSIKMYVFIWIRSCRREDVYINTRLLFQSPPHWRPGQTVHDSALTLPLLFTTGLRLPGNTGQQHTGSSACRQPETGNRWAVRADSSPSPSKTKHRIHWTKWGIKSIDIEDVSSLIFASFWGKVLLLKLNILMSSWGWFTYSNDFLNRTKTHMWKTSGFINTNKNYDMLELTHSRLTNVYLVDSFSC